MTRFKADVQYNDMKGTAAADRADRTDPTTWLRDNGKIGDEEFVVGISMLMGEHYYEDEPLQLSFLISELKGYKNIPEMIQNEVPLEFKEIHVDMKPKEFFSLFKRLSLTLSNNGLVENREYKTI